MDIFYLYNSFDKDGDAAQQTRNLLLQTHWFSINTELDPKTGETLPQPLSTLLAKITQPATPGPLHDRVWRITEHARPSIERLFRTLNESPRREQAVMPVRSVRELNPSSFIRLSKRPGRNIREKLAGKPHLHAVRRFQSIDLPENRLLKAFVTRLAELLELRRVCLKEIEDELLTKIRSWLRSNEALAIARWDNLPPNNTLLSHRDYRRIWDAWRWLQTLDEDIANDFSQIEAREKTMHLWNEYGKMYSDSTHVFAEMSVFFDYEKFAILPWLEKPAFKKAKEKLSRSIGTKKIFEQACIDLTTLRPRFATSKKSSQHLDETYLWQQWSNGIESIDLELFTSDAAFLHPDASSLSSTDLFFTKDHPPEHRDRAARAFALKLSETFQSDTLTWLIPDLLNDFELEIIRRNINARFPQAEPLPRSVAAVFDQVDYDKIKSEGFSIVVVDTIGGKTVVTKLRAQLDPELKKRLPETKGFYWERCPPVILSQQNNEKAERKTCQNYDIITVNSDGKWNDKHQTTKPHFIAPNTLKKDPRIGSFAFCIHLTESPVTGGIRLSGLQKKAENIPLWRDHIPELSIKGIVDGHYGRFNLVGKNTTVRPIRGRTVPIEIEANFPLQRGKEFYSFPLFIGEDADELGFSARLDSAEFPLNKDTICQLNLTFTYGADEPYQLIFTPLDKSFPPVRTTWQPTVEEIVTDAPAPDYPTPMTWEDLRRVPKPEGEETSDFLHWLILAIDTLLLKVSVGEIINNWRKDRNGKYFAQAYCNEIDANVFIHEHQLLESSHYSEFKKGDRISFKLLDQDGRFTGLRIAPPDYNRTNDLLREIHKSLYVPIIGIWRDGRSLTDVDCPKDFASSAKRKLESLASLSRQSDIPQSVKEEILFLLACLHKDTTEDCVQWITEQVENEDIRDPQLVGFSLGDASEGWQQYILTNLASKPNNSSISVFAYAIWRQRNFTEIFSISELQATLKALTHRLEKINTVKLNNHGRIDHGTKRDWMHATTETLELLLGLLRTRNSKNSKIKMLLQPHQQITKELAKQVERVTEIVTKSNVELFSRVQLNIQKPKGDLTPDLLYALRLYLTGDDGANAIHITSISDND